MGIANRKYVVPAHQYATIQPTNSTFSANRFAIPRGMNVGCLFITITKPLPDEKLWYKIGEDVIEMTWGKAKIFFHEKIAIR
jgi:hypothetical protein